MNIEDPEHVYLLEARLRRLHESLDASPGFEARVAARIAATRAAVPRDDARPRLEREYARACARARREARFESCVTAIAGVGGVLAAWQLAPDLTPLLVVPSGSVHPAAIAIVTLAATAASIGWMLRRFGVGARTLLGA